MREEFDCFMKNGFPKYDAPYVKDHKYVVLFKKNNKIIYGLGNNDIYFLVTHPKDNQEYSTPEKVLQEEMKFLNAESGIIYENLNGKGDFESIAFVGSKK
jgi:hypothetical protein